MEEKKSPTTPYMSFKTFQNVLDRYVDQDIPSHIDSSLFPNMSGGTFSQLTGTLRFFGLINGNNETSKEFFGNLVDPNTRKETLKTLLKNHYEPLFSFNLKTTTPKVLRDTFYENMNAPSSVQKNALNFFVQAAQYAGIEISPNVVKGIRNLSSSTKKRVSTKPKTKKEKRANEKPVDNSDSFGDLKVIPIPLGISKYWKIGITEEYNDRDLELFLTIAKSVLKQELENQNEELEDEEDEEDI